jgi:hypothetical protein
LDGVVKKMKKPPALRCKALNWPMGNRFIGQYARRERLIRAARDACVGTNFADITPIQGIYPRLYRAMTCVEMPELYPTEAKFGSDYAVFYQDLLQLQTRYGHKGQHRVYVVMRSEVIEAIKTSTGTENTHYLTMVYSSYVGITQFQLVQRMKQHFRKGYISYTKLTIEAKMDAKNGRQYEAFDKQFVQGSTFILVCLYRDLPQQTAEVLETDLIAYIGRDILTNNDPGEMHITLHPPSIAHEMQKIRGKCSVQEITAALKEGRYTVISEEFALALTQLDETHIH